jgi:hypothetical protein
MKLVWPQRGYMTPTDLGESCGAPSMQVQRGYLSVIPQSVTLRTPSMRSRAQEAVKLQPTCLIAAMLKQTCTVMTKEAQTKLDIQHSPRNSTNTQLPSLLAHTQAAILVGRTGTPMVVMAHSPSSVSSSLATSV